MISYYDSTGTLVKGAHPSYFSRHAAPATEKILVVFHRAGATWFFHDGKRADIHVLDEAKSFARDNGYSDVKIRQV